MKTEPKALNDAIVGGDVASVAAALASGADVNCCKSPLDDTPLDDALMFTPEPVRFEVVRLLVEHGADVNHPGVDGCRPLFHAALGQQNDIFEFLLSRGADPNFQMGDSTETLFDWVLFDYCFDIYDFQMPEPCGDEEDEIDWLTRLAVKYQRPEPRILQMLKACGAKRHRNLQEPAVQAVCG